MRPTKFGWGPDIARCIALPVPRDTSEAITGPTICMVNYNQFTERKITSETGRKIFSIWSTGIREGRNVLFCLLISTKPQHVINIFMKLVVALYYYTHNMSLYIIVITEHYCQLSHFSFFITTVIVIIFNVHINIIITTRNHSSCFYVMLWNAVVWVSLHISFIINKRVWTLLQMSVENNLF